MINGIPRILIVRLSAIGDVVRVLPALHALRDRYPGAQIDWVVEGKSEAMLEGHPAIDRRWVFHRTPDRGQAWRTFRALMGHIRDARYELVLDFHGIAKSGLLTWASRAPRRIGFARPRAQECSWLAYTERVRLPHQRLNRIEENWLLCAAADAPHRTLDVAIEVPDAVEDALDPFFTERFGDAKRVVAVHVAVDRPEKQWPLAHFAALCDLLMADGRFDVLLTYGPGQRDMAERVAGQARRRPLLAPETPDLKHYAALLQRVDLYVGGDTGPMHIAAALGMPTVAIFGGTDPAKHAPLRQPSRVVYAGADPFPGRPAVTQAENWLAAVEPESVYDACVDVLYPHELTETGAGEPSRLPPSHQELPAGS